MYYSFLVIKEQETIYRKITETLDIHLALLKKWYLNINYRISRNFFFQSKK